MTKDVISKSKLTCREHIIFIAIVLEGTGFANQGINNVTVIDVMTVFTTQSGQYLDAALGIPGFYMITIYPYINVFSDISLLCKE